MKKLLCIALLPMLLTGCAEGDDAPDIELLPQTEQQLHLDSVQEEAEDFIRGLWIPYMDFADLSFTPEPGTQCS